MQRYIKHSKTENLLRNFSFMIYVTSLIIKPLSKFHYIIISYYLCIQYFNVAN